MEKQQAVDLALKVVQDKEEHHAERLEERLRGRDLKESTACY